MASAILKYCKVTWPNWRDFWKKNAS